MWRWAPSARVAVILACTFAIYVPALGGGYLWDDDLYVRDNTALRSLAGLGDIWRIPPGTRQYYPVTFTSFWIEYQLWGDRPLGYHVVNLILHGANALLVWRLLAALEVPGAFAAGLLFAVHPVHVESVAWIAERKNVLSGLFALLATLAWVRFLAADRRRDAIVTGAAFLAALLSKTQVCALPAILFLLTWWKRPGEWRRCVAVLAPLVALAVAAAAVTLACEPVSAHEALPMPHLSAAARVLVAGHALWFYVATLLWPTNLMAVYGHWPVDVRRSSLYGFPLAAAALLAGAWGLRHRIGKGPFVALAAFAAGVAPALGLVNFNFLRFAFVADRFQYLASIPLIALVAAGGAQVTGRAGHSPMARMIGPALLAVAVALLAALTWQRAAVHRSEEALWRDNVARDPRNAAAYNHLGNVLLAQRRLDEASDAFATAVRIDAGFADAQNNWGTVLKQQGRVAEALGHYEQALQLNPADPVVHNNLGVMLQIQGQSGAALQHFADAARLDPGYADPRHNWGTALLSLGRAEDAVAQFRAAVRLDPTRAAAQRGLGVALLDLGRADEGVDPLDAAVRLDPTSAETQHHLGVALGMTGHVEQGLPHLATAARLAPDDAEIQNHWGVALTLDGRLDDAVARFSEALRLKPDYTDARDNLARALARRDAARRSQPGAADR